MYGKIYVYDKREGLLLYYPRLKETRIDNDKTQKDVAKLLQISQQQYSLYENGDRTIPTELLCIFCCEFGISADYILGLPEGLKRPR